MRVEFVKNCPKEFTNSFHKARPSEKWDLNNQSFHILKQTADIVVLCIMLLWYCGIVVLWCCVLCYYQHEEAERFVVGVANEVAFEWRRKGQKGTNIKLSKIIVWPQSSHK